MSSGNLELGNHIRHINQGAEDHQMIHPHMYTTKSASWYSINIVSCENWSQYFFFFFIFHQIWINLQLSFCMYIFLSWTKYFCVHKYATACFFWLRLLTLELILNNKKCWHIESINDKEKVVLFNYMHNLLKFSFWLFFKSLLIFNRLNFQTYF